jgi:hypothetical protein
MPSVGLLEPIRKPVVLVKEPRFFKRMINASDEVLKVLSVIPSVAVCHDWLTQQCNPPTQPAKHSPTAPYHINR